MDLFKFLIPSEEKEIPISEPSMIGEETKDIIEMIPEKKEDGEDFSDEISKSLVMPECSITKIAHEKKKFVNG